MFPGKRDVVSVRSVDGEKVKLQKWHLYSSLKETHAIFNTEHLNSEQVLAAFQCYGRHK